MAAFVNLKYSAQHLVDGHAESAYDTARKMRQGFFGTRGLATFLLSAMAAAVMVIAYGLLGSVTEGHLVVMWMALWAVAFTALALFAGMATNVAARLKVGLSNWWRKMAEDRSDQCLWALAKSDSRVMSDLQMAILREEAKAELA